MPAPFAADTVELSTETRWYCVRAQPKRERVAFGQLRELPGLEVFFPQVRYRRAGERGARTVVEAMFPGYLFARFAPARQARAVGYARGVAYIVRQGRLLAPLSDEIVAVLRGLTVEEVLELPPDPWRIGEEVRVIAGIFRGAGGRIVGLMPARQRVNVLLELLGRENRVELPLETLAPRHAHPLHMPTA